MKFAILKFGGSNFKSVGDVQHVISILTSLKKSSQDMRYVVVVSALYGVTDKLVNALRNLRDIEINNFLDDLYKFHRNFLGNDDDKLRSIVFSIEGFLLGAQLIGRVPDFVYDTVVSHGERCSAYVLSEIFRKNGLDFSLMDPKDFIVTDGKFGGATIILERTEENILANVDKWISNDVIVPGFYGASPSGDITILGRGGSDYTATALGYCLRAEYVALFKDVPGFLTGDPRAVSCPSLVSTLSYDEADELSYFGAKVLHYNAVDPLRLRNIPLYICDVTNGFDLNRCTRIVPEKTKVDSCVKSISSSRDIAIVQFKGRNLGRVPGVLGEIARAVASAGINIKFVITSQTCISLIVSRKDGERVMKLAESLRLNEIEEVTFKHDKALIAVVGEGLLDHHGIASRIFKAVADGGINVEMISAGASEVSLYFIVPEEAEVEAVRRVHDEFWGGSQDGENDR
ncbi:aspartate kinase [Fervidobacterium thailandense]|uniref:Aspartokinase n=1 Tax=Fervidobacterium thailandense TaxID=1008305 RepID=A0A1E3G2I7_9BACT|nr:aspartate kinase [Fervidobacterium thailandense]ODN30486.1 hypothetical protein A4H02_05520 [Fervidobacterium thailandense]